MRPIHISFIAICCFTATAPPSLAQEIPRVGEVIIVGNTITQDRVIRAATIDLLVPGQILRKADMRRAQDNLKKLGIFKVNPKTGVGPTVHVLNSPGPFKDILIKVEEGPTRTIKPMLQIRPDAGWVVGFVIEERNFDLWQFPTCVEDFIDGKAFGGGGEKWRVELGSSTLRKGSLPFGVFVRLVPDKNRPAVQNHAWNILSKPL